MKRLSFCLVISLLTIATLVGCGGSFSSAPTPTPAEIAAADKSALAVGYASGDASSSITQNLTLATSGSQGSTITWNSSNPAVISNTGVVSQPPTSDATVTLTATITMSPASDTRIFPLTVKAQMTDAEAVAAAKSALDIVYASGDSATSVTKNVTLAATGVDTSTISWASTKWTTTSKATSMTCASTTACSPPRRSPKSRRKSKSLSSEPGIVTMPGFVFLSGVAASPFIGALPLICNRVRRRCHRERTEGRQPNTAKDF